MTRPKISKKLIDAKLLSRPLIPYDCFGVTQDKQCVEIIAYSIDREEATCITLPKDVFTPIGPQLKIIKVNELRATFLKCDLFTMIVSYPFEYVLNFSTFKLLLNEQRENIIAIYILYATHWGYRECNIYIPRNIRMYRKR